MISKEFDQACRDEIDRLEPIGIWTKLGVLMLEAGGDAREWVLAHPSGPNLRNRLARGELVEREGGSA